MLDGINRTTLWRWVRDGHFPKPFRIGTQTIAWRRADIEQWLASRPAA